MPTTVFLFGTDHRLQCGGKNCTPAQSAAIQDEVRAACSLHRIGRIAEEISIDGLNHYDVTRTNIERVASLLELPYQQVDVSAAERALIALDDRSMLNAVQSFRNRDAGERTRSRFERLLNETRERIWAGRLLTSTVWPVLFVVGSDHVKSFRTVWHRLGTEAAILYEDYAA
jgi:hypothetical protein